MSLSVIAWVITIGAFALRFRLLDGQDYWWDEFYSVDSAGMNFKTMFSSRLRGEQNPPLHYMMLWVWVRLVGFGPNEVRALGVIAGAVTVGALWWLGREVITRRAANITMVLAAVSGLTIRYQLEARGYAFATMCVALCLVPWGRVFVNPADARWPRLFLFCFFGALAGFFHYYGNLAYALLAAVLLAVLWQARNRQASLVLVAWFVVSLAPLSVWLAYTRQRVAVGGLPEATPGMLAESARAWWQPVGDAVTSLGVEVPPTAALIVALLGWAVLLPLLLPLRRSEPLGLVLFGVFVTAVTVGFLESLVWKPTFSVRNTVPFLPLLYTAAGVAIARFRRASVVSVVAAGLVLALAAPTWLSTGSRGSGDLVTPQYSAAVKYLIDQHRSGAVLVGFDNGFTGDWRVTSALVTGRTQTPLQFPPEFPVVWASALTVPTLKRPFIAFSFHGYDFVQQTAFLDAVRARNNSCVPVEDFREIVMLRCG